MKKVLSILLIAALVLALSVTAFADQTVNVNNGAGSITVENATVGQNYKLYQLFDASYSDNGNGGQNVIYRICGFDEMDADEKADAVAVFEDATAVPGKWFSCTANGEISAREGFNDTVLRAAGTTTNSEAGEFRTWAESYGTLLSEVEASDKTLKFDKLAYGYYMITSDLENSNITPPTNYITVNSNLPDVKVIDKNQGPNWDNGDDRPGKLIIDDQPHCGQEEGEGSEHTHTDACYLTKVNEANLDEPIHFDIGVDTTNYNGEAKIWKYVVTDKIAGGMSYVVDTEHPVVVTVGGVEVQPASASNPNGYTIKYYSTEEYWDASKEVPVDEIENAQFFRIELPWTDPVGPFCAADCAENHTHNPLSEATHLYAAAAELHVNYYAKLDSAKADKVNYESANLNEAKFTWYEDYNKPTPDGKDPEPKHPKKETETFVTELKIFKYKGAEKEALQGAEFTLTRADESFPVYTSGVQYVPYDAAATDTTTNPFHSYEKDGTAIKAYYELKSGGYTDMAPTAEGAKPELYVDGTGATKFMKDTFTEIKKESTTNNTTISAFVDANGNVVFKGLAEGTYTIEETVVPEGYNKAENIVITVTFDAVNKTWSAKDAAGNELFDGTEKEIYAEIENKSGSELPETGGIGTTIFYAVGAILFFGAGMILVTRRKADQG